MKILLVHNFYGSASPSGENKVFEHERDLLTKHGHEVHEFVYYSDNVRSRGIWELLKVAIQVPWNKKIRKVFLEVIKQFDPDVIHVHNTFPIITPSIFYGIKAKIAVVVTLHNYRLFCPAAIPLRCGKVCTKCLDRQSILPSIYHGCYRNSRLATIPIALNVFIHRLLGTWQKKIHTFITLSEFQKQQMVSAGLDFEKTSIKPNFITDPGDTVDWNKRGDYIIFVGRLSQEKGIASLIKAWQYWSSIHDWSPELRIVGDGPLKLELEIQSKGLPIKFLGQLSSSIAQQQIANAKMLVLPSEWFEGFPMVVAEAFAAGTPIAASNLGPLPFIVEHEVNGLIFESNNPLNLFSVIKSGWEKPNLLEFMSENARKTYESNYTPEKNYKQLIDIYSFAIANLRN